MISSLTSKGVGAWGVGLTGVVDSEGLTTKMFATSFGTRIPDDFSQPSEFKLVVSTLARLCVGRVKPAQAAQHWQDVLKAGCMLERDS
jgi:hypothetical protein